MRKISICLLTILLLFNCTACGPMSDYIASAVYDIISAPIESIPLEESVSSEEGISSNITTSVSGPAVGDTLDVPEVLASITDFEELTLSFTISSATSNGTCRWIMNHSEGNSKYYYCEKPSNASSYESECYCYHDDSKELFIHEDEIGSIASGNIGFTVYRNGYGVPGFESAESYMLYRAGILAGLDYNNWITDTHFVKCEDSIANGFSCYVYDLTCTDKTMPNATYCFKIFVDKETGLWVRLTGVTKVDGMESEGTIDLNAYSETSDELPTVDLTDYF